MSNKFETIKAAVFFTQQSPHLLAEYIANLIADVVTRVEVLGSTTIVNDPVSGATAVYTGKAYSQFNDEMDTAVVLTLKEPVEGITIADGTVTVASTVVSGTTFTVVGTANEVTGELLVTVE